MSESRTTLLFPPPPRQYSLFTDEDSVNKEPPLPPEGSFTQFGATITQTFDIPSLEERGIPILYDQNAPLLQELKKVNHLILFTFQDLITILSCGNEDPEPIISRLKSLFINAEYILAHLRDVQAYEHTHIRLKEQREKLKEFKETFEEKIKALSDIQPPTVNT